MPTRIHDEPKSSGREPERAPPEEPAEGATRSGASIRREEADESEFAGEIREREQDEPTSELDDE